MKANQKFRNDDHGVSPVIAVILMVAITVVLAATVYVWVSGFGSSPSSVSKTMALSSADSIHTTGNTTGDTSKNYTIAAASSGMKFSDVKLTLDGAALNYDDSWLGTADKWRVKSGSAYIEGDDTASGPNSVVSAGQTIELYDDGGSLSGKTLRVLDSQANSVILTLVIG